MNEEKKPCVEKLTDEEVARVTGGTTGAARPGETNSQDKTHEFEKHDCKFV